MADNDAVMDVIFRFKTENQGAIEQAKKGADEVGKRSENSARMGQRAFSQLGRGISTALSAAAGEAGTMNKQLADSVRLGTQLGQAFIFGGSMGIALTGIALAIGKLVEVSPAVSALNQTLDQLQNKSQAQRGLIELTGVTDKQADAMLRAAAINPEFAKTLRDSVTEIEKARNPIEQLTKAVVDFWEAGAPAREKAQRDQEQTSKWNNALLRSLFDTQKATELMRGEAMNEAGAKQLSAKASKEKADALVSESSAINENNRLMDIAKSALPQLVAENKNYSRALTDLKSAHDRAQKAFDADAIAASARATESLVQAERNYGRSLEEVARGRGREIEDDARARIALERDITRSILKLNQDLINELKGINDDAMEDELGEKTYAEVLKVRRDVERRRQDAIAKSVEARKEIEERKKEREEELNFQKGRRDEDYEHQKTLLDRALNDSREAAQKQLNEALTTIQQRRDEENAAYTDNRAKSAQAHAERLKELTDIRPELQRTRDAANEVLKVFQGYAPAIALAKQELQGFSTLTPGGLNRFGTPFMGPGMQRGGSFTVPGSGRGDRPFVLPLEPGEQVNVTPRGQSKSSRPIINVYIGGEKLDARIDYRIDMNDRGL